MAGDAGVGFTDVGSGIPGTQSSQFDSATFQSWGSGFYSRLAAHVAQACDSIGYVARYLIDISYRHHAVLLEVHSFAITGVETIAVSALNQSKRGGGEAARARARLVTAAQQTPVLNSVQCDAVCRAMLSYSVL